MAIPVEAFGHHGPGFESFRRSFPAPLTSLLQAFSPVLPGSGAERAISPPGCLDASCCKPERRRHLY